MSLVDYQQKYLDLKRAVVEYHEALGQFSAFKISISKVVVTEEIKRQHNVLGESLAISSAVLQQLLDENPETLAAVQIANASEVLSDEESH